ncbi:MAG: transporter substrate-binding domain-containing protein [Gammaproteobacteria bacterium]|nr:transporter substrate-binding domain-containing protein [Gammaproteobacteria bacterium]
MSALRLILGLAFAYTQGAEAAALRVCFLSHNLPYSARATDNGFDVEVARAVAGKLHREIIPVWIDNPVGLQEIDDSDIPTQRLAHDECDAIFSVPGPARDSLKGAPLLALGAAYYGAAFELFGPPGISSQLKALREKPVAIQAQTVASFALAILQAKQRTYFSVASAVHAVTESEAYAALLWGPTTGWYLVEHPQVALKMAQAYEPPAALRWNLHVATRAEDATLRLELDGALADLRAERRLEELAGRYGFAAYLPFTSTYSLTEINKLR